MRNKKTQLADPAYNELLKKHIDKIIEQKRKDYVSDLEPFEVYAEKVRKELEGHFHLFHERFMNGYEVMIRELKQKRNFGK